MRYYISTSPYSTSSAIIFDSYNPSKYISEAKISISLNAIGCLTLTIYPGHPLYDNLNLLVTPIFVKENSTIVFRGRIIRIVTGLYNQKTLTIEEYNGFLMDSRVRPDEAYALNASNVIYNSISNHNKNISYYHSSTMKVSADRGTFIAGNIAELSGSDRFVEKEYPTTWDFLNDRVISQRKGYFVLRYVNYDVYFDYKKSFSNVASQSITFGKNLLDFKRTNDASSAGTTLIPLGDMVNDQYMVIKSAEPSGLDYVSSESVPTYGRIERIKHWSSQNTAAGLYQRGYGDRNRTYIRDKVEITALDMSGIDETVEPFRLGDTVRIISEPHGYEDALMIKKISRDFLHPENNKVEVSGSGDTDNDDD